MERFKLTSKLLASLFRLLVESDSSFDLDQPDSRRRMSLMKARSQPRQVYEELLLLGADTKASDGDGSTVLHHFFCDILVDYFDFARVDAFLDRGEILALLI